MSENGRLVPVERLSAFIAEALKVAGLEAGDGLADEDIGFDLARRHTGCDEVGNPANQQVTQNQHRGNQQQLPQRVVLTAEREQNLV